MLVFVSYAQRNHCAAHEAIAHLALVGLPLSVDLETANDSVRPSLLPALSATEYTTSHMKVPCRVLHSPTWQQWCRWQLRKREGAGLGGLFLPLCSWLRQGQGEGKSVPCGRGWTLAVGAAGVARTKLLFLWEEVGGQEREGWSGKPCPTDCNWCWKGLCNRGFISIPDTESNIVHLMGHESSLHTHTHTPV